jgi:hypothetical protein
MRILLKCPTRSRPHKVMETLRKYVQLANHPEQIGVAVSCDTTDPSMTRGLVKEELIRILGPCEWKNVYYSDNHTKIEACNADMNRIEYPWDIVVLVSDDMIPQIKGYDDILRSHMTASFPDTNGILWFNDGAQGNKLNTLCIFGRRIYERFGYIYHPAYKSLFCDTELTDLCNTTLKDQCRYYDYCIIRHEHPGTGFAQNMDGLYQTNQKYWNEDMYTYIARKTYPYDWSVLIPTIAGRETSLQNLLASLREKLARLAPDLRVEYCIEFDNRELSIGMKRQKLLERASGKYLAFIDDDDDITDAYIEDLVATIRGNHHVMRLRGSINPYSFTHSIQHKLTDPMAQGEVFVRPPNHLNPMMSDVAKLVRFGDAQRGEDLDWTIRLARTGYLTNEYRSDSSRIHYIYNIRVPVDPKTLDFQRNTSYETMLQMVWTPNGPALPQAIQPKQGGLRLGRNGFVSM